MCREESCVRLAGPEKKGSVQQDHKTLLKCLGLICYAKCTGHTPLMALWTARP